MLSTIIGNNGNGTSQTKLWDGSVITDRGEAVDVGQKAFIQNGEIKGAAPGLVHYEEV